MPELAVPRERRPSVGKYVVLTAVGLLLINAFVAQLLQGTQNPLFGLGLVAVAGLADIALLLVVVQSLIQEWLAAAEITDE